MSQVPAMASAAAVLTACRRLALHIERSSTSNKGSQQ